MKKIILSGLLICSVWAIAPAVALAGDHHEQKKKHFKMADVNDDGQVTKQEFLDAASKRFQKLDRNGDGVLNKQDRKKPKHD